MSGPPSTDPGAHQPPSRVGLVLGGGGITGAAYQIGALMAIRLATGWDPNTADVVVGTSSGSFVSALVRNEALTLDSMVMPGDGRQDVAERIRSHVYTRAVASPPVGAWIRHGLLRGMRRPGLTLALGAPGPYDAGGIAAWVSGQVGERAAGVWPERPTAVVAYDLEAGIRTAFGTDAAPEVSLSDAVAASSAIPLVFAPYPIGDRLYVDGGVASGTHADLVLGAAGRLDLVMVVAPMAAPVRRRGALPHEKMLDRVGLRALHGEIRLIRSAWPECEILVLAPAPGVQAVARPNPLDSSRSVATFIRTLTSMKSTLAQPETWETLSHHLGGSASRRADPVATAGL